MRLLIRRRPRLFGVAILILGLGIGVVASVMALVQQVLLRPLPYRDSERIVAFLEPDREILKSVSGLMHRALDAGSRQLSDVAIFSSEAVNLTGLDQPRRILASPVSSSLFEILGLRPQLGRVFDRREDRPGQPSVAVIAKRLWEDAFGAHEGILGRSIQLNGIDYTIIGVLPDEFSFPGPQVQVWIPIQVRFPNLGNSRTKFPHLLGKLHPNSSVAAAQEEASRILHDLEPPGRRNRALQTRLVTLREQTSGHIRQGYQLRWKAAGNIRRGVLLVLGATLLVLAAACASVTSLMLIEAKRQQSEIALLSALGAAPQGILRSILLDGVLMGTLSGAVGWLVASASLIVFFQQAPPAIPGIREVEPDLLVFATALALGLLVAISPICVQSWLALRRDPCPQILAGAYSKTGLPKLSVFASGLVVAEFAFAALLLVCSGLIIRSFIHLESENLGLDPTGVVVAQPHFANLIPPMKERQIEEMHRIRLELEKSAAFTDVAAVAELSFVHGRSLSREFVPEGSSTSLSVSAEPVFITPQYFRALGVEILEGMAFSEGVRAHGEPVAIIDRITAERLWPGQSPIGRRLQYQTSLYDSPWRRIIGVSESVRGYGLRDSKKKHGLGQVYMPLVQHLDQFKIPAVPSYVARQKDGRGLTAVEIRNAVNRVDPGLPTDVYPLGDLIRDYDSEARFYLRILVALALVTCVLAASGCFSLLGHRAALRRHECGVRLALGATHADVRRIFVRNGLALAAAGILLGCAGAATISHALSRMLMGVDSLDAATFAASAGLLLLMAFASSWLPARQAMSTHPHELLRSL